jgi:hypothetical protein
VSFEGQQIERLYDYQRFNRVAYTSRNAFGNVVFNMQISSWRFHMKMSQWTTVLMILGLASATLINGQTPKEPASATAQAPDNTKNNKTDGTKPTADQQKQNPSDVEITRQIRQLVTKDKQLSTNAKNVKIITQNGNVTLAGPVGSEEEKKSVEAKANQVAGASHVKSDIQIAAKPDQKQPEKKNP